MRVIPLFLLLLPCWASVVDRVAVVIDKKVITESEVVDELRLTEFLNNQPLDLSPAARRTAAEHLVDQEMIHRDMVNSGYSQPSPAEADALLRKFRQEHYGSEAALRAAMQKYGIGEDVLKQRLVWQLTAIRFTDQRFRATQPDPQSADRASADRAAPGPPAPTVDQRMDSWLKQARDNSKIVFKQEAFQ
jgi:hypothetical protein